MKDYTDYSYESLVERMTELLSAQPGWGQGYESSTGQTLIQLVADTTDALHYMLERRSQEAYTSTALLESSIWAAASEIGYRPRRKVSATGTLRLTLVDGVGAPVASQGNINIPYGMKVFFDGEEFAVAEDYTVIQGESTIDIKVIQGKLVTESFNFDEPPFSTQNYIEFSDYKDKEEFSLKVIGDGVIYNDVFSSSDGLRVRSLSFADRSSFLYDIKYARRNMRIVFGDGVFGAAPFGSINVSWIESKGANIDVINTGLSFAFDSDVLTDDVVVNPANEYTYTLSNITPIRGGRDEETIDEIRDNLTAFVRTNDRAVTNFDYEFWTLRSGIGDIVDVSVYGEQETNQLIFTMNNVYVTYVTGDRLELNSEQVTDLRSYLDQVKVNLPHLVFAPANELFLSVVVEFKREPGLPITNSQLYRVLQTRINEYFEVGRGVIGKGIQHSEFIEFLQNLTFVFNNINYALTDFVKVRFTGMVPFTLPKPIYDATVTLSNSYTPNTGDVWNLNVNGDVYTITVGALDTLETIIENMKQEIFAGTNLMLASPETNQIRIKHPSNEGSFTISVMAGGDLQAQTTLQQFVQLPRASNVFNPTFDQILPGSVQIVSDLGVVLYQDNGSGLLVDSGSIQPSVEVDYVEARFEVPNLPDDSYFVRFQQNDFQNFNVTNDTLISIMPLRDGLEDDSEFYFSSITLL